MFTAGLDSPLVRRCDCEGGRRVHDHAQVSFGVAGTPEVEVEPRGAWVDATCGPAVPAGATHTYRAPRAADVPVLDGPTGPCTERPRRFALAQGWRAAALEAEALQETLPATSPFGPRRRSGRDAPAERIDAGLARELRRRRAFLET